MKKNVNKNLKIILVIALLIVLFASLEALMNAKSIEALNNYRNTFPNNSNQDYLNFILLTYIFNIIEPIVISLYLFLTYNKIKPNKLQFYFETFKINRNFVQVQRLTNNTQAH